MQWSWRDVATSILAAVAGSVARSGAQCEFGLKSEVEMEEELRAAVTEFLVPLPTTRVINQAAFDRLRRAAVGYAERMRTVDKLSKSILREIHASAKIILAEAPFFGDQSATLQAMAGELQKTFDLILIGEAPGDRKPGVPRIL
jgi:hypothetical protein